MIIAEQITINDRQFTRTYSDSGFMVERDGVQYSEAIDLSEFGGTYTETDIPIEGDGELTVSDTLNMLNELGVNTDD